MAIRILFPDQADHTCPLRITVAPCEGASDILDLSDTTFAKPFGITLVYGLISFLRQLGDPVHIVAPPAVATYLWRMNVHVPFTGDDGVTFEPDIRRWGVSQARPETVLPLTCISVENDDEVVEAGGHLWDIISARAPQFVPVADQIRTALVELISNVERHSQAGMATVIAQTHRDAVRLAVGDVGIGVRRSLQGAYPLAGRPDHDVLKFATEPGVTATPGGGGTGLWTIVDAIQEYGRAVHLGSGQGVYSVYRGYEQARPSGLLIPGTIVEVAFERPKT